MTPGMPGAVLTTVYYLLLVLFMPVVVLVRVFRGEGTQTRSAAALWALTVGCLIVALVLWRLGHVSE